MTSNDTQLAAGGNQNLKGARTGEESGSSTTEIKINEKKNMVEGFEYRCIVIRNNRKERRIEEGERLKGKKSQNDAGMAIFIGRIRSVV